MRQENFSHWAVYSLIIFVLNEHQTFDLFGLEPTAIGCRMPVVRSSDGAIQLVDKRAVEPQPFGD